MRVLASLVIGVAALGAGVALVAVDGATTMYRKQAGMAQPLPAIVEGGPAARVLDPAKPLAVVVAGNRATEITDFLPPFQMLAASGAFNVVVVAPERAPAAMHSAMLLPGGVSVVPDYSFAEYQAQVGRAPDLIAIPYLPGFTPEVDAATVAWIRQQAGPETRLVTICAGVEILAATGLLDGHRATGNRGWVDRLRAEYPAVAWQEGMRYVEDGRIITSARLNAGIDATLAMIDRMAGRPAALAAAHATGYQALGFLDRPQHQDPAPDLRAVAGALLLSPRLATAGVPLADGVDEAALAATLEYAGTTFRRAATYVPGDGPVVSRFGLTLLPAASAAQAATFDEVLAIPAGEGFGYDVVTREQASRLGGLRAASMARNVNYPTDHLELQVAGWDWEWWRPLVEVLLGMSLVLGTVRWWRRRAVRSEK